MSVRNALAHRNLLYLLSLKELRTRYRQSILGWAWSLLNPLSQMVIFSVIFLVVFKAEKPVGDPSGLKNFPLYFLVGLIPFQFFAISVTRVDGRRSGRCGPHQEGRLPARASRVRRGHRPVRHDADRVRCAVIALLIAGNMVLPWIPVLLPILLLLALFTTGVSLALAGANVFFHDVNYLWSIISQLLFYATPIIYVPSTQLAGQPWLQKITNYGPTGSFVRAIHEVMYDLRMPGLGRWGYLAVISVGTFALGAWIFDRLSPRFAEEL